MTPRRLSRPGPTAAPAAFAGSAVTPRGPGLAFLAAVLLAALLGPLACRGTQPADEEPAGVSLALDVVPLVLRADTTQTATVWATLLEDGSPVVDSTRVSLVTTLGQVSEEAFTVDGLAVATYRAAAEAGQASIVAQARGVRDTMRVTLY